MGNNNLATLNVSDNGEPSNINQFKEALCGNYLPRTVEGIVGENGSTLGTDEVQWIKANIEKGYWNAGDIKPHHTYNGVAPIGQGWYPCDGTIINETNYNAIHGADSWTNYIGTSIFDGKYSVNMIGKYLTGANSTTSDGSVTIPSTGNSGNQVGVSHLHSVNSHNHQWLQQDNGEAGRSEIGIEGFGGAYRLYDSGGNLVTPPVSSSSVEMNAYTSNVSTTSSTSGSATQTIQPESLEVIFYMRLI